MRTKTFGQSSLLMLDVIDILNQRKIPYAVIGAMAASFYGVVRASLDSDAVLFHGPHEPKIKALKELFTQSGLNVIIKKGDAQDPLIGLMLIEDAFGNQVDLILGIRGMDSGARKRTKKGRFQGQDINMIGLEDFIAMKIFAGGVKDINDVKGVLKVSGDDIDRPLLMELTKLYGKKELEMLKEMFN